MRDDDELARWLAGWIAFAFATGCLVGYAFALSLKLLGA
jgi:hypothetical protein